MIQKKLVNLEHWWVRLRPFVMWRLLAGTLYGSLVLGGSATWLGMTVAFAAKGWGWILFASLVLIFAPVPCLELIQAPPHVWRRPGRLGRWEFAWVNAVVFAVAICMLQWVLYGWISPARGWEGVSDLRHHVTTTAMASFLGYVVNLFWREKPIFGPE